ncbi:MAG: hypothetical protein R2684_08760 [Pyrinomonadaceae bacterium]
MMCRYILKSLFIATFLLVVSISAGAQPAEVPKIETENLVGRGYKLVVEKLEFDGFPGLQSFAYAQHQGKWLILGGRTDGLHRRQPFASFALSGTNRNIFVVDPESKQVWKASVTELPAPLSEQLYSSNMEFLQDGNFLYLIGGYGISKSLGKHLTHDKLISVKIDCLVAEVQKGKVTEACFQQLADPMFAVTGGQIGKIGETIYLVGGQRFDGRYNPMGPDHGPGFSQKYITEIRKIRIKHGSDGLGFDNLGAATDSENLRRRDFNMLPQIFPGNKKGFTIFSGVFRPDIDLPFTNTVDVFPEKHLVKGSFNQFLSHYHSAKVALYDSSKKRMENIFFGGISQYEVVEGVLKRDDNVPFVKTVSKVTREKNGAMKETILGELPGLYGASAEFAVNPNLSQFENEIVRTEKLKGNKILLGHVIGGINSSRKNVFFGNSQTQSDASSVVFRVWLVK